LTQGRGWARARGALQAVARAQIGAGNSLMDSSNPYEEKRGKMERLKRSVFMLLYLISKDQDTPLWFAYMQAIVSSLQLLFYAFSPADFMWHKDFKARIVPFLRALNLAVSPDDTSLLMPIGIAVSLGLLVFTFALCFKIGANFWARDTVDQLWTLWVLQLSLRLLTTILYVPVLSMLTSIFANTPTPLDQFVPLGSAGRNGAIACTALVMVLFVALNCFVALCFVDNNPKSRDSLSQVHGRSESLSHFLRAVVSIASAINLSSIVLMIVITGSAVGMTLSHIMFLPFHRMSMNRLFAATNGLFLWACICLVVAQSIGDETDHGSLVGFLLGVGPAMYAISALVDRRAEFLATCEPSAYMSPFTCELILRFRYQQKPWEEAAAAYKHLINDLFPNNIFLVLHLVSLAKNVGNNEVLSAQLVQRAQKMPSGYIDQQFILFRIVQRRREQANGTQAGALSYVAFTHHRKQAEEMIIETLASIERLWEVVGSKRSNHETMLRIASKVYKHSTQARAHLDELVARSNGSRHALMLYALYADEVLGDTFLSQRLRQLADTANIRADVDSADAPLASVTVSGSEHSLGQIVDTSEEFPAIFGVPRNHAVGQPGSILFPSPLDKGLDKELRNYLVANNSFVTNKHPLFIKHLSNGYAVQYVGGLSAAPTESGEINFTLRVFPATTNSEFMVCDIRGTVVFYSRGMVRTFGLRQGAGKPIFNFLPNLEKSFPHGFGDFVKATGAKMREPHRAVVERPEEDLFSEPSMACAREVVISVEVCNAFGYDAEYEGGLVVVFFNKSDSESDGGSSCNTSQGPNGFGAPGGPRPPPPLPLNKMNTLRDVMRDQNAAEEASSNGSSIMSSTSRVTNIRKLVQMKIAQEEKRVNAFFRLCMRVGVVLLITALSSFVIQSYEIGKFHVVVDMIYLSSQRTYDTLDVGLVALHYFNDNMGNAPVVEFESFDEVKEKLKISSDELRHTHERILAIDTVSEYTPRSDHLNDPHAVRFTLDGAKFDTMSFHHMILKLSTAGLSFRDEIDGTCGDSCRFILNNAAFNFLEASFKASELLVEQAVGVLDEMYIVDLGLSISSSILICLIAIWQLFPVVKEGQRSKGALIEALSNIPRKDLRRLYAQSQTKHSTIREKMIAIGAPNQLLDGEDEDGEDKDGDFDDFEATAPAPGSQTALSGVQASPGLMSEDSRRGIQLPGSEMAQKDGRRSTGQIVTRSGSKVVPLSRREQKQDADLASKVLKRQKSMQMRWRRNKRCCSPGVLQALKLCAPLMVLPAYFSTVMVIALLRSKYLVAATENVLQTGMIKTLDQAIHFLQEFPTTPPEWHMTAVDPVATNITALAYLKVDRLEKLYKAILYGDEELNTQPMHDQNRYPMQYHLLFENACDTPECLALLNSGNPDILVQDLQHGLAQALYRYIERTKHFLRAGEMPTIPYKSSKMMGDMVQNSIMYTQEALVSSTDGVKEETRMVLVGFCFVLIAALSIMFKVFQQISNQLRDAQQIILLIPIATIQDNPKLTNLLQETNFKRRLSLN